MCSPSVVYVAGRPHVLRLQDRPLVNVEATGVSTEIVESMELSLKRDVIREIRMSEGGRILLHDEVEQDGTFETVPVRVPLLPLGSEEVFDRVDQEADPEL